MSYNKTDIKNEFRGTKYPINHISHSTVGQIDENIIFKMAAVRHIGYWAAKNSANIFTGDTLATFFYIILVDDKSIKKTTCDPFY